MSRRTRLGLRNTSPNTSNVSLKTAAAAAKPKPASLISQGVCIQGNISFSLSEVVGIVYAPSAQAPPRRQARRGWPDSLRPRL